MDHIVEFRDVSKCFNVRHEGPRSLQSMLIDGLHMRLRQPKQRHWVLRNIDFVVRRGEMLGIVGVNGSGKSTTLKLISRIIEPTTGQVEVKGRVSALLELGAGFHPDLTGRENVYLNGSILGLSKRQIHDKFDEIVDFAELESSIDLPVRHYSSGMYMRLGFSVAIHVNPDILLIDEVLAVGDYAFQFKCLECIDQAKQQGMTIVFVSHSVEAIKEFCDRAIWLDSGGVYAEGAPDYVVECYLNGFISEEPPTKLSSPKKLARGQRWGTGEIEITNVQFLDANGVTKAVFATGEPLTVRIHYLARKRIESPVFGMAFYSGQGAWINGSNTHTSDYSIRFVEGEGWVDYCLDNLPLLEGSYLFTATAYDCSGPIHRAYDHLDKAFVLRVRPGRITKETLGMVYMPCHWEHRRS